MIKSLYAVAAAAALVPAVAMAGPKSASGSNGGVDWTAASTIIGQESTGTGTTNPTYLGHDTPAYNGVVQLRMDYGAGGAFVCSGTLMTSGRIVTAAHCISSGAATNVNGRDAGLVSTTAYFYNRDALINQGNDPIMQTGGVPNAGVTAVQVSSYHTNLGYTGEVIDQNDIAVLTLANAAPAWAARFDLYSGGDLSGEQFNVAGYGLRSGIGGANGYDPPLNFATGRLREGDNVYDYNWGHDAFGDLFTTYDPECNNPAGSDPDGGTNWFCGYADIEYSYISDFDQTGSGANNQACFVALAIAGVNNPAFCGQSLGLREVSIASGDSGGPGFINGQLASVNSYGLTFGTGLGDYKAGLQSSWGELNGYVPTFIHADWIASVPEPSTWALLILGFGLTGAAMRRKGKAQVRYAI